MKHYIYNTLFGQEKNPAFAVHGITINIKTPNLPIIFYNKRFFHLNPIIDIGTTKPTV